MVKKYADLYLDARKALLETEGDNAANVARELLCHVSHKTAAEILRDRELYASEEIDDALADAVRRYCSNEPLAYILGQWEFYGMTLTVTPAVLIPRDDTMAVAQLAVQKTMFLEQNPRVLDLCAGSGCIGLAVANRVKDARVTLGELSKDAIAVARKNIVDLGLSGRVNCLQIDAKEPAKAFLGKFDLIVSNPPYITEAEMETLEPSVRDFEPHMALCGGRDGLEFYRAIVENYTSALKPGGWICFEFGLGQGEAVQRILTEHGYRIETTREDEQGILRAVLAQHIQED